MLSKVNTVSVIIHICIRYIYTQSCRCEIRTFTDRGISLAQSHIMVPFPLRGYQVPLLGPRRSRMEY